MRRRDGRASPVRDGSRPEPLTPNESDHREVPLLTWYPARPDTGTSAPYVPELESIRTELIASGAVNAVQAIALGFVRDGVREGATVSPQESRYPVLLLSPGDSTNVAFYAALAEDLASHGYVVVGLDHPFSVAATVLRDGTVAAYHDRSTVRGGR